MSTKFGIEAHDVKAPAPKHNITIWHFRRRYRRVPATSLHTTVGHHPEAAAARRCKDKQAESRSGSIATEAVRVCIHALRSVPKADANLRPWRLSRRANRRIETGHPVETSRASAGDRIASPRLPESGLRSNTMRSLSRTTAAARCGLEQERKKGVYRAGKAGAQQRQAERQRGRTVLPVRLSYRAGMFKEPASDHGNG